MSLKGELVIRDGGKWYVSRNIVHTDDYSLHLVVGDVVEFELDRIGFARIKGCISIRRACVNSLLLYLSIKKMIPASALETVHRKVVEEANLVPVTDKKGDLVLDSYGSVMLKAA